MKKKIALFMAAVMSLSVVPVASVFGATEVSVKVGDNFAKEKDTAYNGNSAAEPISYFLDIVLDDDVEVNSQFIAELSGAKFTNVVGGDFKNLSYFSDDDFDAKDPTTADDYRVFVAGAGNSPNGDGLAYSITDIIDGTGAITNNVTVTKPAIQAKLDELQKMENAIQAILVTSPALESATKSAAEAAQLKTFLQGVLSKLTGVVDVTGYIFTANDGTVINLTGSARSAVSTLLSNLNTLLDLTAKVQAMVDEVNDMIVAHPEAGFGSIGAGDYTSGTSATAVFSDFANAGLIAGTAGEGNGFVAWTNMIYTGTAGTLPTAADPLVPEGTALVKRLGDTRIRVTFPAGVTVASRDAERVVRIPLPLTTNADAETVELNITSSSGEIPEKSYMLIDTTAGGTTTHADAAKGREIIELETIIIDETTTGVLGDGAFELLAPDGYRFRNKLADIKVKATGDASFEIDTFNAANDAEWTGDDNESVALAIDVTTASSKLPGTLEVSGLVIEPIDDDSIVDGEELFMTIRDFEEDLDDTTLDANNSQIVDGDETKGIGVDREEFKVADSVDWGVTLTVASVKDLTAGRWAKDADDDVHATAEITISETEDDTWRATRTTQFTLPEGVKIRGVNIKSVDGIGTGSDADERDTTFAVEKGDITDSVGDMGMDGKFGVVTKTDFKDSIVTIDENVMTWKNIDNLDDDAVSKVTFVLYLSIAPTYAEDTIALQLEGTAIDDEIAPVTIANVKHPITVTTKATDVQIGYQRYTVADIVIKENFAGAILEADSGLVISMDNDRAGGLELVEAKNVTVEGDIKISDASNSTNQIAFDVTKASSKTPSTITLSNVEVYVDRTVPYGTYSVSVGGESVFANVEGGAVDNDADDEKAAEASVGTSYDADDDVAIFARFSDGYKADYIRLATEGAYTPLKAHVVISAGSSVALVDGVEKTMVDVVPYRTTAEGASFMVPVRFASEIFGIAEKDTLWDDASKTFTIFTGGRTIQFVGGADYYVVNGARVTMLTNGVKVLSEIDPAAGRMYIPFRHLGVAFGIADADITYNEAAETAEYNQPRD